MNLSSNCRGIVLADDCVTSRQSCSLEVDVSKYLVMTFLVPLVDRCSLLNVEKWGGMTHFLVASIERREMRCIQKACLKF